MAFSNDTKVKFSIRLIVNFRLDVYALNACSSSMHDWSI